MSSFPKIFRVRQTFDASHVEDVRGEVEAQLGRLNLGATIGPGQSVAVTAGSRGIANIAAILRAAVAHLSRLGAKPFLVPSMGSHGGATAEGQCRVLDAYGITEAAVGCPIRSSMETVVVGQAKEGFPIHFDRLAFEADHVLVCGRVKSHTTFAGEIESGLMKMLLLGLGKHDGAIVYHQAIQDFSFDQIVRSVASEVLQRCRVVAGLAIVENAYEQTARIEAIEPARFEDREKELLVMARRRMARLPFPSVDVLVIDQIGKNISGVGCDANVVGRKFNDHKAVEGESPKVKRICFRGLTPESHGNALGMGIGEFCRSRLLRDVDFRSTRLNALTSGHVAAAMRPLDYETDREMLEAALGTIGLAGPREAKLLWIANTLDLAEVECAACWLDEARGRSDLTILSEPRDLPFDRQGNLPESI